MSTDRSPALADSPSPRRLIARLERVRASLLRVERSVDLAPFGDRRESAVNLLHYIAFRRFDLRRDQALLARLALSSLGRSESHVLYNLEAVLGWLDRLQATPSAPRTGSAGPDPDRRRPSGFCQLPAGRSRSAGSAFAEIDQRQR